MKQYLDMTASPEEYSPTIDFKLQYLNRNSVKHSKSATKMKNIITVTQLVRMSLFLLLSSSANAQLNQRPSQSNLEGTSPNYRLSIRDRISVTVFDEANLAHAQGIDAKGEIKMPLLGVYSVAGLTVRDVEQLLETQYVEKKILRNPIVNIDVLVYSPKEISALGPGIARAGMISLPPEIERIDIVDLISMAGGFTPLAKRKAVIITRDLPNGSQLVLPVNVEEMIEGRKKNRKTETVYIYPGDLIYVDEVFL
jgi:protein involved in polysaccharide export with SLBB domain